MPEMIDWTPCKLQWPLVTTEDKPAVYVYDESREHQFFMRNLDELSALFDLEHGEMRVFHLCKQDGDKLLIGEKCKEF